MQIAGTFSSVLLRACGQDLLSDTLQSITLAMLTGRVNYTRPHHINQVGTSLDSDAYNM